MPVKAASFPVVSSHSESPTEAAETIGVDTARASLTPLPRMSPSAPGRPSKGPMRKPACSRMMASGRAASLSILLMATMIGTPAALV